jgi:hypothetical protein
LPTVKDFVAKIEGVCGGDSNLVVILRPEKKDKAAANILKRCVVKKRVADYMFELEFNNVVFRLFSSGRIVFRGIEDEVELDNLLTALFQ